MVNMEDDSCLLCFQSITIEIKNSGLGQQYGDSNYKQKLFQCCRNLLRGVGIKSSFNWNSDLSTESYSPFCSNCFQLSETLWLMEEKLNEMKRDLDKYIERVSAEILQSRINALSEKVSSSVEGIPDNSADNISEMSNTLMMSPSSQHQPNDIFGGMPMDNDHDSLTSPLSPTNSMEIKIEIPKEEMVDCDHFDENYFDNEASTMDDVDRDTNLLISLENHRVEGENQLKDRLEKNWTPHKEFSEISPFRILRVSLERLKLDSKGNIIQPLRKDKRFGKRKMTQPLCKDKRFGKRKAAMAAKKLLRKSIRLDEYSTENKILSTKRDNDDDFINDEFNSDVEGSEDGRKIRIRKSQNRRMKINSKSELKCVVCQTIFPFSSQLDAHSKETGHKNEKTVQCHKCHEKFYRCKEKEWHLRTCNFEARSCKICGEIFSSFKLYRYHLRDHRKGTLGIRRTKSHKCEKCHLCFFTQLNLSEHMKTHDEKRKQLRKRKRKNCTLETEGSTTDITMEKDDTADAFGSELNSSDDEDKSSKTTVYSYKDIKCISCSSLFKSTAELDAHSEESGHVNEKCFGCSNCNKKFYRDQDLHSHKRGCHFVSKSCSVCGIISTSLGRYRKHLRTHSGSTAPKKTRKPVSKTRASKKEKTFKTFKCSMCYKAFSAQIYLTNHMNTHTGEKPFRCDIGQCKAKFGYHSELSHHKVDHENESKVQCKICDLFYKDDQRLSLHLKKEHTEVSIIQCDSCEMQFKKMNHFVSHKISSHGMESPYKCKHCGTCFNYKLDLTTHLSSVHDEKPPTGNQPHCCTVCDQMFKNATSLYYHILSHTTIPLEIIKNNTKYLENEKGSYQCEECGKVFPYVAYLKTHLKYVHSERILPCKICGKIFKTKNVLKIHELIHTDERFVCEMCGRGFTKKCNLETHIKRIHEQNKKPRKSFTKTPFATPK